MNRQENLYLLSGVVSSLDDSQLSELYAYAIHMTKREIEISASELSHVAQSLTIGLVGMLGNGEKQATTPKQKRKVKK